MPFATLFLQAAGVDYGQGWYWGPALPAAELPKVLEAGFPNWRRDLVELLNEAR
jgi:EAL domain-containing protein (putative c-di-GMP-specific phosphodiesterase class I)